MTNPPGIPSFTLAFLGLQQRAAFKVLAFKCREQFNQPYAVNLELVHEDPKLDPEAFLNHQAVLTYGSNDDKFYGRVYRFAQSDKHQRWTHYQEVFVTFRDDDPDKPIISGCLYNGANDVPYPLPANKTRSVFKTANTQGGGGSNEISFEDKQGAEEIYTNAERDWSLQVGNDQNIDVGNALNLAVNGLATKTCQDQLHTTVTGNRVTHLQADEHPTVTGDRHVQTGDYLLSAADQVHLEAGGAIVLLAPTPTAVHFNTGSQLDARRDRELFCPEYVAAEGATS